jgi:hypothetical protein
MVDLFNSTTILCGPYVQTIKGLEHIGDTEWQIWLRKLIKNLSKNKANRQSTQESDLFGSDHDRLDEMSLL